MDAATRRTVRERAADRCEYCQLPQSAVDATFHVGTIGNPLTDDRPFCCRERIGVLGHLGLTDGVGRDHFKERAVFDIAGFDVSTVQRRFRRF